MKRVALKGFQLRGNTIYEVIAKDRKVYTVTVNGEKTEVLSGRAFTIKLI